MSASLRAGNSSDGYLQIDGADIVGITASGMAPSSGKTITANQFSSAPSFRNKIIGGDFTTNPWQRGTSFTPTGSVTTYTADRWSANRSVANYTVSRVAGTLGRYALKIQRTAATSDTNVIVLAQVLETANSWLFQGKSATLSAYIKAGANYSGSTAIQIYSGTGIDESLNGSGNFPTGNATVVNQAISPTTTNTRFTATGTCGASISQLAAQIRWTPSGTAGADDSITIELVQLEEGSTATPFESRPYGVELALCQRYYFKTYDQGTNPATATYVGALQGQAVGTAANTGSVNCKFAVAMRSVPSTVTVYSPGTGASANFRRGGTAADVAALTQSASQNGVSIYNNGTVTASEPLYCQVVAEAEL